MPSSFGIGFLLFVLGICNYVRTPVSEAYIVSQTSKRNRSTILGIYYFSNMEGGGVLTPVMGFLIDVYGFYFGFSVAGIALVVLSVICLIWIRRYRN
jgi:sugar phosphate permease